MVTVATVAEVLGLPKKEDAARTPFGLMTRIKRGLPVTSVERMAQLLAPTDTRFKYKFVPKATYERRKAQHLLTEEEGTRLARVARVWSLALEVWGSEEEARSFLFRPHPMLQDERPIDVVLQNEIGGELALEILGRLKYGSAA